MLEVLHRVVRDALVEHGQHRLVGDYYYYYYIIIIIIIVVVVVIVVVTITMTMTMRNRLFTRDSPFTRKKCNRGGGRTGLDRAVRERSRANRPSHLCSTFLQPISRLVPPPPPRLPPLIPGPRKVW